LTSARSVEYLSPLSGEDDRRMMRHAGVPVRVVATEEGFLADYTALSHFLTHPGGTVRADTEALAVQAACDRIDEAIFEVAHQLER